jgi:hypothetical protein
MAAEILLNDAFGPRVIVRGEIKEGDFEKLTSMLKKSESLDFEINSRGGNVAEAAKIGRFVRSSLSSVWGIEECWSACALILMGVADPTDRLMLLIAPVGIRVVALHRPYLDPALARALGYETVERAQLQILEETKKYLLEMGVEAWVYEKMITKSSQDAWLLENEEVRKFFSKSAAYEEWILANCDDALSKSEDQDASLISLVAWLEEGAPTGPSEEEIRRDKQAWLELLIEKHGPNWRDKYDSLNSSYKTDISEKSMRFHECKSTLVNQRHKEVLASLP